MPGSVSTYGGKPENSQMLGRTPIISEPGHPGVFEVAYPGGYPSTDKVLLWVVGSSTSTTVVHQSCDHNHVSLAADGKGRTWVFWTAACGSSGTHVYARRLGTKGFERTIDLGAPLGSATSVYELDGSVSQAGNPEALALAATTNANIGTYYARGPQTAPKPKHKHKHHHR